MKIATEAAASTNLLGTNKFGQTILASTKGIILALITITSNSSLIQAQSTNSNASVARFIPPPPSPVVTAGRRQGGASRGNCPVTDRTLTAVVPVTWKSLNQEHGKPQSRLNDRAHNRDDLGANSIRPESAKEPSANGKHLDKWQSVWGLTTMPHPSLWFYVPYRLTPNRPVEFVIQDEAGKRVIYKTRLSDLQARPGLVELTVPAPLEIGKRYQWYFVVNCTLDAPPVVQGWIERIALPPKLKQQLEQASPQQQVRLLATNGIWYDALTRIAKLRQSEPRNSQLAADWFGLLNSVGLGAIASEPIGSCCTHHQSQLPKRTKFAQ